MSAVVAETKTARKTKKRRVEEGELRMETRGQTRREKERGLTDW